MLFQHKLVDTHLVIPDLNVFRISPNMFVDIITGFKLELQNFHFFKIKTSTISVEK